MAGLDNVPGRGNSTVRHTPLEALNDILRLLKQLYNIASSGGGGGDASAANQVLEIVLLTSIESLTSSVDVNTGAIATLTQDLQTSTLHANWSFGIGNDVAYTYDANNNVTLAEYSDAGGLVFTQTFTYDANNNVLTITTT